MVIQFALQDLMYFLIGVLGITVGIILVSILWNIRKMVCIVRPLMENNQKNIQKILGTMPIIFEDVGQISSNVRETTDGLKVSAPVILQEVEYVANAARGSIESGYVGYLHILKEVVQIIYSTFSGRK